MIYSVAETELLIGFSYCDELILKKITIIQEKLYNLFHVYLIRFGDIQQNQFKYLEFFPEQVIGQQDTSLSYAIFGK